MRDPVRRQRRRLLGLNRTHWARIGAVLGAVGAVLVSPDAETITAAAAAVFAAWAGDANE